METIKFENYTIEVETRGIWEYLVRVYEGTNFLGKVISNDIQTGVNIILKKAGRLA